MRVRGSSLCDIAVLMVDIMHGLQGQTIESLKLVHRAKTHFFIGLNKCDRLSGWVPQPGVAFQLALKEQPKATKERFAEALGRVKKQLAEHGIYATPYWRVKDLSLQVPIIPMCAIDGCGIPDLLLFLVLYGQSVLTSRLTKTEKMKCNILEVQRSQGIGATIDVLLVSGEIKILDEIMFCGMNGPLTSTVKSIITAKPMQELKGQGGQKDYESHIKSVTAVQGVKLWGRNLDSAVAGSSVYVINPKQDEKILYGLLKSELDTMRSKVSVSGTGVHVQASTLGSLEALMVFLNDNGVPIGSFGLGPLHNVNACLGGGGFNNTVLAFDVKITRQAATMAQRQGVEIISGTVIYQIFDEFKRRKQKVMAKQTPEQYPCILAIEPSLIIKPYPPITIGVHVQVGRLSAGMRLHTLDGGVVGDVNTIHEATSNTAIEVGCEGMLCLISMIHHSCSRNLVYGRDFFEHDKLYTKIGLKAFSKLVSETSLDIPRSLKLIQKYAGFLGGPYEENLAATIEREQLQQLQQQQQERRRR
eukprot:TRINITY_DN10100_c0_g3_i1.p1 TRINITY_DN10100_c0_g3~~TRINITY_DN10100_c0_g3_i1.p1  ORF type:complete len:530 (+),score=109.80 TRINITY_DN10100_c0_g3_i1:299-1888(+)